MYMNSKQYFSFKNIFYIMPLLLLTPSCMFTSLNTESPDSTPQKSAIVVETKIFILDPQSLSDAENIEQGTLLIYTKIVPTVFTYIEDSINAYTCYDFKNDRHLNLYRKIPRKKIRISHIPLSRMDIERGFYLGTERKSDASINEWIYAEWEGGAAFFRAASFLEIINEDPFTAIFLKR